MALESKLSAGFKLNLSIHMSCDLNFGFILVKISKVLVSPLTGSLSG